MDAALPLVRASLQEAAVSMPQVAANRSALQLAKL
jgi:hypothetical protein